MYVCNCRFIFIPVGGPIVKGDGARDGDGVGGYLEDERDVVGAAERPAGYVMVEG